MRTTESDAVRVRVGRMADGGHDSLLICLASSKERRMGRNMVAEMKWSGG